VTTTPIEDYALLSDCHATALVSRAGSAILYRGVVGSSRGTAAAGLLQATSLPFIVTATAIGAALGLIRPATGSALVAAGLLSVMIFPTVALGLLRTETGSDDAVTATAPQGT
jgi:hypothetical protein